MELVISTRELNPSAEKKVREMLRKNEVQFSTFPIFPGALTFTLSEEQVDILQGLSKEMRGANTLVKV